MEVLKRRVGQHYKDIEIKTYLYQMLKVKSIDYDMCLNIYNLYLIMVN